MASTQPELDLFGESDAPAASASASGKLFTIPPSAPFLDTLARAILSGDLPRTGGNPPRPEQLADYLIYLPNRAACRALGDAFLRASPNDAILLPRIRPLGSAEEDALLLLAEEPAEGTRPDLPIAPAIGALERRMVLTQLILAWANSIKNGGAPGQSGMRIADTPAAAAEMALDLMRLMDEAETEGVDLARIRELMPERFADHEQLSLSFLDIVLTAWPNYLAERGLINPIDRRNRIMALETERLRGTQTPVIIAGSTGSIPATAGLMRMVLSLDAGAIVLPGVDLDLDEESWNACADHPEHPQSGLYHLLASLDAARRDVAYLKGTNAPGSDADRRILLSHAIRPAATIGKWPEFVETQPRESMAACLKNVSLISAPTEQDEAAAIALVLREAAETPGKTANLVTPDRTLARRVAAELGRWDISLADTSGEPLRGTPIARFYDHIVEAAANGSQISLLELLKDSLTRLGLDNGAVQKLAGLIEIGAMRQAWCGNGLASLSQSLDLGRKIKPRHRTLDLVTDEEWDAAEDVIARLTEALEPLTSLMDAGAVPFAELARAHAQAAGLLATNEDGDSSHLSAGTDGEAMAAFMIALGGSNPGPALRLADYPALFRNLLRLEKSAAPADDNAHPRLAIMSAMDARLTSADLVIIAGLNEGCWPEAADPGPWLNRSMREALGLPSPERRIRLAGHDFWQMMGAPEVVLTRALKSDGTPTVPCRWLMRMEALLQGFGLGGRLEAKQPWLQWAAARNMIETQVSIAAPSPCPPVQTRPRRLSVSDITALIANPYAIYAKHILDLAPLDPLEAEPGGSERGRIIHEALHLFARRYPVTLPSNCVHALLSIFDEQAALYGDNPRIKAFWRPRLERFAEWFAETEPARRSDAHVFTEVPGTFTFDAPAGPFTLRARADRIDIHTDGALAIYDYKSGTIPSESAVTGFKTPQLPLEALIATEGHFDGMASRHVMKLVYISAKGGEPAGIECELKKEPPEMLAKGAREGLIALIENFDNPATPYRAMRRAAFTDSYPYDAYAHLARVGEWQGASEEG